MLLETQDLTIWICDIFEIERTPTTFTTDNAPFDFISCRISGKGYFKQNGKIFPYNPGELILSPGNNRIVYNADESRLSEMLRYISAHLEEKLTTEVLANEFHMSRSTLDRLFRMYAEQTVKDTITECRISTAKDLLSAADVHIKEIMVKCGFQSENHFFAFFKSHIGITPNKYRQANYTDKFNLKQC